MGPLFCFRPIDAVSSGVWKEHSPAAWDAKPRSHLLPIRLSSHGQTALVCWLVSSDAVSIDGVYRQSRA